MLAKRGYKNRNHGTMPYSMTFCVENYFAVNLNAPVILSKLP